MKKIFFILTIIAIAVCLIVCLQPQVEFKDANFGIAKYSYKDINFEKEMSNEDLNLMIELFDGKKLKADSPSCGFTEDVSVKIDKKTFCIACDTCGIIYLLEEDKYFRLSDENKTIREILNKYGFVFPCV